MSPKLETVTSASSQRLSPLPDLATYPPIRDFRRLMTFHILICETPMAILECLVKIPILLAFGCFLQLAAFSSQQESIQSLATNWLREAMVLSASLLSFLFVPGIALKVYENFDAEEAWQLGCLPTLVGPVDARRFYAFVHGYGEMASQLQLSNTGGPKDSLSTTFVLAPSIAYEQGERLRMEEGWREEEEEEDEEERKAMAWLRDQGNGSWLWFLASRKEEPRLESVRDVRVALRESIDTR